LFGSALDAAVEAMLLGQDYELAYKEAMDLNRLEINGKKPECPISMIRYSTSDADINLIGEEHKEFLEYCKQQRKAKTPLNDEDQTMYNELSYLGLYKKGELALPVLKKWIDENVAETVSTQQKIEIENEEGDSFVGYLDFVVKLNDGRTMLIDLKTSSDANKYYPEGCVEESRQLAIYAQEVDLKEAAYLVVDKKIRKREGIPRLKYVEGSITDEQLDNVFDEIAEATVNIKEGTFEKNKDACWNWGGCEFRNYCNKGGDMTGLEYVEKR
jgi:hypothetical protein